MGEARRLKLLRREARAKGIIEPPNAPSLPATPQQRMANAILNLATNMPRMLPSPVEGLAVLAAYAGAVAAETGQSPEGFISRFRKQYTRSNSAKSPIMGADGLPIVKDGGMPVAELDLVEDPEVEAEESAQVEANLQTFMGETPAETVAPEAAVAETEAQPPASEPK